MAVYPWLRQLLKPLEFALKAASDSAVSWRGARGRIGPGSRGLSSHPGGSHSAFNLGGGVGCLRLPCACRHAGCSRGPAAVPEWGTGCPHHPTASPWLFIYSCFRLQKANIELLCVPCLLQSHRCPRCSCPLALELPSPGREDPNLHPTTVMAKVAFHRGFLCARLRPAGAHLADGSDVATPQHTC